MASFGQGVLTLYTGQVFISTITLTNGGPIVNFDYTLPSGQQLAASPSVGGTCANATAAGVITAVGGGTTVAVRNLQVSSSTPCNITFSGTNRNGALNSSCTNFPAAFTSSASNFSNMTGASPPTTRNCTVYLARSISNANSGVRVVVNGQPANGSATNQLQAIVRDNLGSPMSGQVVNFGATPDVNLGAGVGVANSCVTQSDGTCTIQMSSTSAGPKSTEVATYLGHIAGVFTYNSHAYVGNPVNYSFAAIAPQVSMSFSPASIGAYGAEDSRLLITLSNPHGGRVISDVGFVNNYTAGLENIFNNSAETNCTGGTVTALNNQSSIRLEHASIPANSSCTVSVQVSARDLLQVASYTNTLAVGSVTSGNSPANTSAASATLQVQPQPYILPPPLPISCASSGFVFNTAYATDGSAKSPGSLDNQWMVGGGTAGGPSTVTTWLPAHAVNPAPDWVVSPFPNANWISARKNKTSLATDTYYRYDFRLPANIDAASFSLQLDFYADEWVEAAFVNGAKQAANGLPQTSYAAVSGAQASTAISTGWQTGLNSLVLHVHDIGGYTGFLATARTGVLCRKPTITLKAVSNAAPATFAFTGNNGFPDQSLAVTAPNTPVAGAKSALAAIGAPTVIEQAATPPGFELTGVACTGLGTGGSAVTGIHGASGGSVALNSAAVANDRDIVCTFTNTGPPTLGKAFSPGSFSSGGKTSVVFTLSNPVGSPAAVVGFTDTLPANLVVAVNPAVGGTCANVAAAGVVDAPAGGGRIAVAGLEVPAGASCTLGVDVTNRAGATNEDCAAAPAGFTNAPGNLAGLSGVLNGVAAPGACLVIPAPRTGQSGGRVAVDRQLANGSTADRLEVLVRDSAGAGVGGQTVSFAATPDVDLGRGMGVAGSCVTLPSGICGVDATSLVVAARSTAVSLAGGALGGTFVVAGNSYGPSPLAYSFVLPAPSVAKAFAPAVVSLGVASTLTITLSNAASGTPIDGLGFTDTYPAGLANSATPAATTTCPGGVVSLPGVASLRLAGATVPARGSCLVTVQVAASGVGELTNTLAAGSVTALNSASNAAAASASLTVRSAAVVRLQKVTTGVPGGHFSFSQSNLASVPPAIATTAANTPTPAAPAAIAVLASGVAVTITETAAGAFVLTGARCTDANAAVTGNTGVFGTLSGATLTIDAANVLPGADIGCVLTSNSRPGLGGRLFGDTGAGGGTANDGLRNGAEPALVGVVVRLTDCVSATLASTLTDGGGGYSLEAPAAITAGTRLCVEVPRGNGRLSTGASAGGNALPAGSAVTVGGTVYTYGRSLGADRIAFAWTASAAASAALDFGSVPPGQLVQAGLKVGRPGGTVSYGHVFTAGTGGSLRFAVPASVSTPALAGWSERVFADPGCTGSLQPGAAQLYPPAAPQAVTAGQVVCIVVQEAIPATAPQGMRNVATVEAAFDLVNTSPALSASYRLDDVTTVSSEAVDLLKEVRNVSRGVATFGVSNAARPGETLEYRITYANHAPGPVTELRINDTTPAFTTFSGATVGSTPASLTGCRKLTPADATAVDCALAQPSGGKGALEWVFTGVLLPGGSGSLLFRVLVD